MAKDYKLIPSTITVNGKRLLTVEGYLFENGTTIIKAQDSEKNYLIQDSEIIVESENFQTVKEKALEILQSYIGKTLSEIKERKVEIINLVPAKEYEKAGTILTKEEFIVRCKINEEKDTLLREKRKAEKAIEAWRSITWKTRKNGLPFSVVSMNLPENVRISGNEITVYSEPGKYGIREDYSYTVFSSDEFSLSSFDGVLLAVNKAIKAAEERIIENEKKLGCLEKDAKKAIELFRPLENLFSSSTCDSEIKRILKGVSHDYYYPY